MKKVLFTRILAVILVFLGVNWGVSAQDEAFNKGDRVAQLGIGIGSYITWIGYSTKVPPIPASFEYGALDLFNSRAAIGLGGYLAYTSAGYKGDGKWNVSDLIIGPRGFFHYQFVEKLDTYAGLMFGYEIVSYSHTDSNLSGSSFITSLFVGARYYFAKNIAVYGELGYGVAPLEVGIAFKF